MAGRVLKVMVSSTFRDLKAEREAARDAILSQGMLPLMMEHDSAIPDRGLLTNSRAKVEEANVYLVLISNYRYGQIIAEPDLNPNNLSITQLEFEWAEAKGLKICAFLMEDGVPPPSVDAVLKEAPEKPGGPRVGLHRGPHSHDTHQVEGANSVARDPLARRDGGPDGRRVELVLSVRRSGSPESRRPDR